MAKAEDQFGISGINRNTNNKIAAEYKVDPFDKILRDIDRQYGFKLHCSDINGHWAMMETLLE